LLLLRILLVAPLRLAVSIGIHTPRSIVKRHVSHQHEIEFSLMKPNLVGSAETRLTSGATHLSIQGEGENSQISPPIDSRRRQAMTRFKIFGAAAILSLMFATPVFAQAAIQEPGAFAFYYPNNDVLNGGRPTPAAGMDAPMPFIFGSNPYFATDSGADGASCGERYRSYDPSSGTFLGHDGRRHTCG
jgi:hypothetical protein